MVAGGTASVLAAVAFHDGGFFPTTWGWTAFALAGAAGVALAAGAPLRLTRARLVVAVSLAALLAWTLASTLWTSSTTRTVLEAERTGLYLVAVLALLLVPAGRRHIAVATGCWAAISLVALYALATRLAPERLGAVDPVAMDRLSEPLGYWNGLGIVAALGILLALGLAGRSPRLAVVVVAAASIVPLSATLYFTYSRGALGALAAGLALWLAVDPRRLQAAATVAAVGAWGLAAATAASRFEALNEQGAPIAQAADEGAQLAVIVAVLAAVGALAAVVLRRAEPLASRSAWLGRAWAALLVGCAVVGLAVGVVRFGPPWQAVPEAWNTFLEGGSPAPGRLSERLFTVGSGGRDEHWRVALASFREHAWAGTGAGTYEQAWYREREIYVNVQDAHSLYLETLAELGVVGLAVLLAALLMPLVALRERAHPLVPPLAAAYCTFLLHAGVDWDWELTAIGLTGLALGISLLAEPSGLRPLRAGRGARLALATVVVGLGLAAAAGLMGNAALADAREHLRRDELAQALRASERARSWAPWSSQPWSVRAEIELAAGARERALRSLREALARDPSEWRLWMRLAETTRGREQRRAVVRARALNPLSLRLAELERRLRERE